MIIPLLRQSALTCGMVSSPKWKREAASAAVELAKSGVRGILLGHLSKENNTLELAFKTVKNTLTENGIIIGRDVGLGMTKRDSFVGPYTL